MILDEIMSRITMISNHNEAALAISTRPSTRKAAWQIIKKNKADIIL